MKQALIIACAAFVATSATCSSLFDYGTGMADARVPMGDTAFNIWITKRRPTFLIEPSIKTVLGGGGHFPDTVWRTVAEAFVQPIGCGISEVRPLSRMGAAWEAAYVCPAGVDLVALVRDQRSLLKQGEQLHIQVAGAPTVVESKPPDTNAGGSKPE